MNNEPASTSTSRANAPSPARSYLHILLVIALLTWASVAAYVFPAMPMGPYQLLAYELLWLLLCALLVFSHVLAPFRVELSHREIRKHGLTKDRVILWAEAELKREGLRMIVSDGRSEIEINPLMYEESQQLNAYLAERMKDR